MCVLAHIKETWSDILYLMNGQELKERRTKLGLSCRYFAYQLEVTEGKIYCWETGRTKLPPDIEQSVENIEKRVNKRKILFQ